MIETARLALRDWRAADLEPFAALNADPVAMHFFPKPYTREESDALAARSQSQIRELGWGLWAVDLKSGGSEPGRFIGAIGIINRTHDPALRELIGIDIGWRIAPDVWGRGLATEGARAALNFAFSTARLERVSAYTSKINSPSIRIMEKLGMTYSEEFLHPRIEPGHRLAMHVIYRISNPGGGG